MSKPLHIHILGICGTFMGGIAVLAKEAGYRVTGCDANVYPPMSTQLEAQGIELIEGWGVEQLSLNADMYVIGNVVSRGNPLMEEILNRNLSYISGPQWLSQALLQSKWVIAVAGTHGKTTTSSMLAWILEYANMNPGFLIGGVPQNFGISARLTDSPFFVIEADEYDTAFFDKRSKFVHYKPRTAVLNNLEFDHADIFPDLAAIKRQFHHLVRTVPARGRLIVNGEDAALAEVLAMGCWTPVERFGIVGDDGTPDAPTAVATTLDWTARLLSADGSRFEVAHRGAPLGVVEWPLLGRHSVMNALAALAAAAAAGCDAAALLPAFARFASAKRRMEVVGTARGVTVYDDFAHHPTAIRTTLDGLRAKVGAARVIAALEPRSNSMRLGAHADALAPALDPADITVFLHRPDLPWDAAKVIAAVRGEARAVADVGAMIAALAAAARAGDHVVFMSNGGFEGAPRRLLAALQG